MSKKKQKPILSDKIAELIAPRRLLDPEIDSDDETAAKMAHYDLDAEFDDNIDPVLALSDIRKKNMKLLHDVDPKYRGKLSSRKEFDVNSNESEESELESDNVKGRLENDSENGVQNSESDDEAAIVEFSNKLKAPFSTIKDELAEDNSDLDEMSENDDFQESADDFGEEEQQSDEDNSQEEDSDEDDDESDFDGKKYIFHLIFFLGKNYKLFVFLIGGDIIPRDHGADAEDEEKPTERPNLSNILSKQPKDDQIQKGFCVQNQIQIWEKLLEIRIHSHKMLIKGNSLPIYNKFQRMAEKSSEFADIATETEQNLFKLISQMCDLQTILLKKYPETKELAKKRKAIELPEDREAKRNRLSEVLSNDYTNLKDYQFGVISKWHDRTKILTPGSVKTQKQQGNIDVIRKIEGVLANKDELIKKSQLLKGGYTLFDQSCATIVPKASRSLIEMEETEEKQNDENNDIYCTEIYDDTDFYHTQLRELIEYKTNSTGNANEMRKQFIELQKLRKKMKKTVDTRASKGRKIRYVVHNKLVSFMAPNRTSNWDDEQKNELFKSLFGAQS